jgi:hypothetical protein
MCGSTARADERHDTSDDGEAGSRCMRVCWRCMTQERKRAGADDAMAVKAEHGIWGRTRRRWFLPNGENATWLLPAEIVSMFFLLSPL